MAKTQNQVDVLQVTSKRPSFRRAGIQFGQEMQTIPVGILTKAQVVALKAEPMLVVVEGKMEVEAGE